MFSFFRQPKETTKQKVLQALKAFDVYTEHSYEEDTLQAIEAFQTQLYMTIDAVIQLPDDGNEVLLKNYLDTCTQQAQALASRFEQAKNMWEEEKKDIRTRVEKGLTFIQQTNFYPPEYVFHLNKIEGFLIEIDELLETNPFASPLTFRTFCEQVERDIETFVTLHDETKELLPKIEKKCATKAKQETQMIIECKESLFRALQMGNLLQAQHDLKQLKKEYKRL